VCLAVDRQDANGLQLENIRVMFSSFSLFLGEIARNYYLFFRSENLSISFS